MTLRQSFQTGLQVCLFDVSILSFRSLHISSSSRQLPNGVIARLYPRQNANRPGSCLPAARPAGRRTLIRLVGGCTGNPGAVLPASPPGTPVEIAKSASEQGAQARCSGTWYAR